MEELKSPRGRPRNLGIGSQTFRDLYFDPFYSVTDICRTLKISRRTFYRYEVEVGAPKVKIGMGVTRDRAKTSHVKMAQGGVRFDMELARQLCMNLEVRGTLYFNDPAIILQQTKEGKFDFSLASVSWTQERSNELSFSHKYIHNLSPHGSIFSREKTIEQKGEGPLSLGVVANDIHHDFAKNNLVGEFESKIFNSYKKVFSAYERGEVDAIPVAQPFTRDLPMDLSNSQIIKKNYYDSFTGVIAKHDQDMWIVPINESLEKIFDRNAIDEQVL